MLDYLYEILETWIALAIFACFLIFSGAFFARIFNVPGFVISTRLERMGLSLLCGLACIPILLDLAGRFGPSALMSVALVLSALGAWALFHAPPAQPETNNLRSWLLISLAWILVSTGALVDFPDGEGGLMYSVTSVDHVKHAAVTWSIAESGAPPWNPTAYTPDKPAVYYYFYYTLTAAVALIGAPFGVMARHAGYAGCILTGFALFSLTNLIRREARTDEAIGLTRVSPTKNYWTLILLGTTGLDILAIGLLSNYFDLSKIMGDLEWWDVEIGSWVSTSLWVPHHAAALAAAYIGFIAVCSMRTASAQPKSWGPVCLSALAFASMGGMSIYIAIGAVATLVLWVLWLAFEKRGKEILAIAAAGLLTLVLAAPWLVTLFHGDSGSAPLGFRIRGPSWLNALCDEAHSCALLRLETLPIFYLFEFGVFLLGAWMYWRMAKMNGFKNDLGKILVLSTGASLLIGSFINSTIIYNDLGMRITLFAQMAMLVWTISVARAGKFQERTVFALIGAICILTGYIMVGVSLVFLRTQDVAPLVERQVYAEEKTAFEWLNKTLPKGSVVQEQPNHARTLAYGLFGLFPTYISDPHTSRMFGPTREEVEKRFSEMEPVFSSHDLRYEQVQALARSKGISAFIITATDPVFNDSASWLSQVKPNFSTERVRVYLFEKNAS